MQKYENSLNPEAERWICRTRTLSITFKALAYSGLDPVLYAVKAGRIAWLFIFESFKSALRMKY